MIRKCFSRDALSRVVRLRESNAFGRAIEAFLGDPAAGGERVLAIDGETLGRSVDRAASRSTSDAVTAFCVGARVAIPGKAVAGGDDETLAARAMPETLALDGVPVEGDAMQAQAAAAEAIPAHGGGCFLPAQGQPSGETREVAAFFAASLPVFETADADHSRIATRRQVARVEAERREGGRTAASSRFFLSFAPLPSERIAAVARGHRSIEINLRWALDVAFCEDRDPVAAAKARSNSHSSAASPVSCPTAPAGRCSSAESGSASDGPMPTHEPTSATCDSPPRNSARTCRRPGFVVGSCFPAPRS